MCGAMKLKEPKNLPKKPEKSLSDLGYSVQLKCPDSPLINLSIQITEKAKILDFGKQESAREP